MQNNSETNQKKPMLTVLNDEPDAQTTSPKPTKQAPVDRSLVIDDPELDRLAETLDVDELTQWLQTNEPGKLDRLFAYADHIRHEQVGDGVFLRGLIELSNNCRRHCAYCGMAAERSDLQRYRMTREEVIACAHEAVSYGYGTVVIQAGEDPGVRTEWVTEMIRQIKSETKLAITLSLGERTPEELAIWKEAGADRYLLRFETSNEDLLAKIHPPMPGETSDNRMNVLRHLRQLDYEVGSGAMIGIPGQSWSDLARDIRQFRELQLDMIGVGPYLAHPGTPLGTDREKFPDAGDQQVPSNDLMTYKVIALTRIACPKSNIPATTALATINLSEGRELALQRGANIVMPNLTPVQYRAMYEIYPSKACIEETARQCSGCLRGRIESINRHIGEGRGDSPKFLTR